LVNWWEGEEAFRGGDEAEECGEGEEEEEEEEVDGVGCTELELPPVPLLGMGGLFITQQLCFAYISLLF
jgi:hypothetical protein